MLTPAFSILGCAFFCEEGNWLPHISMPWLEICVGPTPQCRHLPWDYLPHTQNLSAMCAAGVILPGASERVHYPQIHFVVIYWRRLQHLSLRY